MLCIIDQKYQSKTETHNSRVITVVRDNKIEQCYREKLRTILKLKSFHYSFDSHIDDDL